MPKGAGLLYDRVANHVASLIARGALRAGQRVPSVRRLSAQMNVSTATVVLGYSHLSARTLFEGKRIRKVEGCSVR